MMGGLATPGSHNPNKDISKAPMSDVKTDLANGALTRIRAEMIRDKNQLIRLSVQGKIVSGINPHNVITNANILSMQYPDRSGNSTLDKDRHIIKPNFLTFNDITNINAYLNVFKNQLEFYNVDKSKLPDFLLQEGIKMEYFKAYNIISGGFPNPSPEQIEAAKLVLGEVFDVKFDHSGEPKSRLQSPTEFNISNSQVAKYAGHQLNIVDQAIVLSPDQNIKEQLNIAKKSYANLGIEYKIADN